MPSNWKTSLSGLVGALAGLVLYLQAQGINEPKWLTATAGFVVIGGFASLGFTANDANKSNVTFQNGPNGAPLTPQELAEVLKRATQAGGK